MPGPMIAKASRWRVEHAHGGPASAARKNLAAIKRDSEAFEWEWTRITHEEVTFARAWLSPVLDRLDFLARLPRGWDGDDGVPASAVAVLGAIRSLDCLGEATYRLPAIMAGPSGSVALEWHSDGIDAEIEIEESAHPHEVELYVRSASTGDVLYQGSFSEGCSYLTKALTSWQPSLPFADGEADVLPEGHQFAERELAG